MLTEPEDSRNLAQTAKGDHKATTESTSPSTKYQGSDTTGQEPAVGQPMPRAFTHVLDSPLLA